MKLLQRILSSLSFPSTQTLPKRTILILLLATIPVLLILKTSYYSSTPSTSPPLRHYTVHQTTTSLRHYKRKAAEDSKREQSCDIFSGEWVPNTEGPYYTNHTCWAIHEHQNCMKYGRPDTGFMRWKWKPDGCELPTLNPHQFLEIMRNKSLAFVGDSVARNQMQSLICLLSRAEYPIDKSDTTDEHFKRWYYVTHNFTLYMYTSTFLVKAAQDDPAGPTGTGLFGLHLDEPDPVWINSIHLHDYLILSAGHWFYRSLLLFDSHNRLFGCRFCGDHLNITDYPMPYIYRRAFRTALSAIVDRDFRGTLYLRTFAPSHFEGGLWNEGGNCVRRKPMRGREAVLEGMNLDMYMAQVEEFRKAKREARKKGMKFRLLDTTQATLMRPDGHPSKYGHWPEEKVVLYNDCVHWCLPGPIDAWNDFLLEMLKNEGVLKSKERNGQDKISFR